MTRKTTLPVALIQERNHGSADDNLSVIESRVAEAAKFGFKSVVLPRGCADDVAQDEMELTPVTGIAQAVEFALER